MPTIVFQLYEKIKNFKKYLHNENFYPMEDSRAKDGCELTLPLVSAGKDEVFSLLNTLDTLFGLPASPIS